MLEKLISFTIVEVNGLRKTVGNTSGILTSGIRPILGTRTLSGRFGSVSVLPILELSACSLRLALFPRLVYLVY